MKENKKLVLPDGSEFYGFAFGADCEKMLELVFNTSPVGYQEIVSDPSYTDQAVVMAYPLIGNYGINDDDFETRTPTIGALAVRDYNDEPSNFRSTKTLSSLMKEYNIAGISGVDTRALVRKIRDCGCMNVLLTSAMTDKNEALKRIAEYKSPCDAVSRVSRKSVEEYKADNEKFRVAAIDFGMKENIVRSLLACGCSVTVFPWNVTADEVRAFNPDGVFLSNGPGDPTDVKEAIALVKGLRGEFPIFGICLGHQIISLAYGAKTYKLKFGHRGGNHPVKNLLTGKIEITSQNHSYAVDENSLEGTDLEVTHINLLDKTVEGLRHKTEPTFSVQYHPESSPGPTDGKYLFDEFLKLMERSK